MGLGFVPGALCWPHAAALFTLKSLRQVGLPQSVTALAIDDQTAAVTDSTDTWQVLGRGQVTLVDESFVPQVYHAGQQFKLRVSVSQR